MKKYLAAVVVLAASHNLAAAQNGDHAQAMKLWAGPETQCRNCHGAKGEGGFGPDLAGRKLTAAQFTQAVRWYNQDARYQYFLGLSQLAQKTNVKRDAAIFSFEQGARIEAKQPMRVGEINASLERIQGELRQVLNSHRYKNIAAITEK